MRDVYSIALPAIGADSATINVEAYGGDVLILGWLGVYAIAGGNVDVRGNDTGVTADPYITYQAAVAAAGDYSIQGYPKYIWVHNNSAVSATLSFRARQR